MAHPEPIHQFVPTFTAQTAHLPTLVDREEERALARHALVQQQFRLLTLTGPPGIGKTRLAVAIATDLASEFPDGVWFIDLSPVREAGSVLPAIADAIGTDRRGTISPRRRLNQRLENRHMLLVLDNFEQVHAAAVFLGDLLAAHSGLSILATSRQPLHLKWEHVITVSPLPVASDPAGMSVAELEALPSVRLFVQSAQARRLDFMLTPENVIDIARICSQVEGVPLEIELAAGWVNLLPPSTILQYLNRHIEFLRSAARDLPPRQQSIIATLDWSYSLLSERERVMLRRLSVFADQFTLAGAKVVVGGTDGDTLDGVAGLVDKSLLRADSVRGADASFHMSNTVKAYASELLGESGEMPEAQQRHARHFLALVEQEPHRLQQIGFLFALATPPYADWTSMDAFNSLDRDHANLLEALRWFRNTGQTVMERRLACGLVTYWWAYGHLAEGTEWLSDARADDAAREPALRLRTLNGEALIMIQLGNYDRARRLLDEALPVARSLGHPQLLGETLSNLAVIQAGANPANVPAALVSLQEALSLFSAAGDEWRMAVTRHFLAALALLDKNGQVATDLLVDALPVFQRMQDGRSGAMTLILLGHAAWLLDEREQARNYLADACRLFIEVGASQEVASAADLVARLFRDERPRLAAMLVGASDAVVERGFPRTFYTRRHHDETVERLKRWLSEDDLDSARHAGRSWNAQETAEHLLALLAGDDVDGVEEEIPDVDAAQAMTDREMEILRLMSEGLPTDEIARTIFVSAGTVKLDIRSIYRKLDVHNRAQAMAVAAGRSLI